MDKVTPGQNFPIMIYVKNYAAITEKDIRVTVSLPELNQIQYSRTFSLKPKQTHIENFIFKLPVNSNNKQEVIDVTVSNNKDKDSKFVFIDVE